MSNRTSGRSTRLGLAMLLCTLLFPAWAAPARAGSIIHVRASATGANNGASWADAYTSLQAALGAASSGDQIWVAKGTYLPTATTDRTISFTLKSGVAVYGGFAGTETSLSKRKPLVNLTILSGDIGAPGDSSDNTKHVVRAAFVPASTILDGFKIVGGTNFVDATPGSGIEVDTSSVTLRNLQVSGGIAYKGSGIGIHGAGSPTISNTTISGNFAGGGLGIGGGMSVDTASVTLVDVTFSANSAVFGGALYAAGDSTVTLVNTTLSSNVLLIGSSGGAVYSDSTALTIRNSIIWDNTATAMVIPGAATIDHSIVQAGCPTNATCTSVIDEDPVLGGLENNGGAVQTQSLGAGSAAIDAGNAATCASTDARGLARPQGLGCDMGAYEVRAFSFRSAAAYDGWVLESGENTGSGGSTNASAASIRVGDDKNDRQYRGLLSFPTASLSDSATVVDAAVTVRRASTSGSSPFGSHGPLLADARARYFGPSRSLTKADFSASASAGASGAGTFASIGSGRYRARLSAGSLGAISRTSTSQVRVLFTVGDNDDRSADFVSFWSGNAGTASNRPQLWVYVNP